MTKTDLLGFFSQNKGIVLEQNKEPALSRELREFCNEVTKVTLLDRPAHTEPPTDPDVIIKIAGEAGIIDETDGKPLGEKLKAARYQGVSTVVVDAIDDEPYISSQLCPALQMEEQMTSGLGLVKTAVGAENAYVAIYKNISDIETKIPKEIGPYKVERIHGTYPAEYRSKRIYRNRSAVVIGTCALIHLHRAVYESRVQSTCFITVAGDCIATPSNLEVSIGMSLQQILDFCGLIDNPRRIVVGGSMTGYSVTDTQSTHVSPTTRGVLAFKEDFKEMNFICIGCGRCAKVCPEGLSPYYIYKFLSSERYGMLKDFDIDLCTGCGTCSYVCPAKLDISKIILEGKRRLATAEEKEKITV